MALQQNFTFRGLTVTNAYHRVVEVIQSRPRNQNLINVDIYASQAAASAGEIPLESLTALSPYNNAMSVESAYTYLKSLPEFAGAVDV